MQDKYVILTGSKNNAGDFLIKYRAKLLFSALKKDREIIDYDAWKPLGNEQLTIINKSKALILTGGPALQYNMFPKIYALCPDLNDIKVPIISMGIGYKDQIGSWKRTHAYQLNPGSIQLLNKIKNSGYLSSVRDYHTLNVLLDKKYDNFLMTGCPALYDIVHIGKEFDHNKQINNVAYSLGVSYLESSGMNALMRETIKISRDMFIGKKFTVLFHHVINRKVARQDEMLNWLEKENIAYKDISGGVEDLIKEYTLADFHIGFRVHAHIFMSSISKPSLLLNEDSRGKALYHVINGLILDAYGEFDFSIMNRVMIKLGVLKDLFVPYHHLPKDIICNLQYEMENKYPRLGMPRKCIDENYSIMKKFIDQLP